MLIIFKLNLKTYIRIMNYFLPGCTGHILVVLANIGISSQYNKKL